MNRKWLYVLLLFLMTAITLLGCQSEDNADNEDGEISVVASFLPMYEFTQQVAGDRADVQLMLSEGQDAHQYEPSAQDVATVNEADVFVYSSEEMEFWAESLLNTVENEELVVARAADGITQGEHEGHDHAHNHGEDEGHDHGEEGEHSHEDDEGHAHGEEGEHNHEEHADAEAGEAAESLDILGLSDHYHTGDVVTLAAELNEEANYDQWQWMTRENAEHDWEAVPDQTTDQFEYQTTGESFEVRAVLYDDDDNVYAESEPVSVIIDDHEGQDPHIWLDPVLAQDQVTVIRDALIEADPDGQETYEENAAAFIEELQALDQDYQEAFADVEDRAFVVQHQAFGYLADRYDLEQIAIGGLSTEVEPSPSRMAEIGNLVQQHDVPVIYYQQGANSSIAQTIADETGTETEALYDLEVYSDELQEADLGYLEAMRHNLEVLQISIN